MGMSVEMAYPMETSEKLKATEDKDKTVVDTPETRREKANEPIDSKTEGFFKNTGRFFDSFNKEKSLFQSTLKNVQEKLGNNPDLERRVKNLEEKTKILDNFQANMVTSISSDPELSQLLEKGSVNYSPERAGSEIFSHEGRTFESALDSAYA